MQKNSRKESKAEITKLNKKIKESDYIEKKPIDKNNFVNSHNDKK